MNSEAFDQWRRPYQITLLSHSPFSCVSRAKPTARASAIRSRSQFITNRTETPVKLLQKNKKQKPMCLHNWLAHLLEWNCNQSRLTMMTSETTSTFGDIAKEIWAVFFFFLGLFIQAVLNRLCHVIPGRVLQISEADIAKTCLRPSNGPLTSGSQLCFVDRGYILSTFMFFL